MHLFIYLSIYIYIYLSVYISICLSVCLSIYLSIYTCIYVYMHSRPSMYSPVLSSSALPFCAVHSISLVHSKKMNGKISTTRLCKISGFRRHVVHIFNILGCCATLVYQPMLHSKLKQLFIRTDTTHLRTSAPNTDSNLKRPS